MRLRVCFSLALQRAAPVWKQPAAAVSGVHKLTIDSAPKDAEATPQKLPEGLALRRSAQRLAFWLRIITVVATKLQDRRRFNYCRKTNKLNIQTVLLCK